MAAAYTLVIEQGATFQKTFLYKSGPTAGTATAVDLTGWTARSQVRPSYSSTTVWAEWTTENGGIQLQQGGTIGRIDMTSSALLTANMPAATGVWDIELVSPTNTVIRLLEGPATITPEVTR